MKTAILVSDDQTLVLSGRICYDTVTELCQQGKALMTGKPRLLVDLSQVSYSDSAGLVLLIEWLRYATGLQQQIIYLNLPEQLRAIANVCGVSKMLPIEY
jgi:phospholipid transport system transporter-binding protein